MLDDQAFYPIAAITLLVAPSYRPLECIKIKQLVTDALIECGTEVIMDATHTARQYMVFLTVEGQQDDRERKKYCYLCL